MVIDSNALFTASGALIGVVLTCAFNQIGLFFDWSQKKQLADDEIKKLLMTKAVELTLADRNFTLEIAKATKTGGDLIPPLPVSVTKHYEYLSHIFAKESVPPEVMDIMQKQIDEHNSGLKPIR